jgi:hypothetical protein
MSFVFKTDSFIIPSITSELTTTSQIRKKIKKSSLVWAHIRMPLENENPNLLYCFYCEKMPYDSENSLIMTKHINKHYSLIIIKKATNKKQAIMN